MSRAQQELASGKRILNASDDPASVPAIVQNQADLARVEQSQSNLNTLNSEVGMASSDLESAATIMDNINSLAAQGATGTTSAQTRQVLAGQIQDLETQMVGIANSTNEGRYLFGGDSDAACPLLDQLREHAAIHCQHDGSSHQIGHRCDGEHVFDRHDSHGYLQQRRSHPEHSAVHRKPASGLADEQQPGDYECRHSACHGGPTSEQCPGFLRKRGEVDHFCSQRCIHNAIESADQPIAG